MAYNHFDYVPSSVTDDRSGFKFKKAISKAGQLGWLYPVCKPVAMLPGSSLKLDVAMEVRSQPLIAPLMDELHLDLFAFNVPNRIVWEHWKQFLGACDDVLFDNLTEYQIPSFEYGAGDNAANVIWDVHPSDAAEGEDITSLGLINYVWNQLLACHFELPFPQKGVEGDWASYEHVKISALPFRGYNFIWNEFFTPEYLNDRILFSKTDSGYSGDNMAPTVGLIANDFNRFSGVVTPTPNSIASSGYVSAGGVVLPVSRAHRSLWTSCLPKPSLETLNLLGSLDPVPVGVISSNSATTVAAQNAYLGFKNGSWVAGDFISMGTKASASTTSLVDNVVSKINEAVLTVNNYRETILLQNYYDALNRAGSRYDEILSNLFHVRTAMAIISIPELIVHKRFTIYRKDIIAMAQTNNGANNVKPIGSQAGYIDTVIKDSFFTKSTTEHGYIHMLMCIRPAFIRMTSGFEPDWTVLNKLDLFYQQFQGMGDVPRRKMEVTYKFASDDSQTAILGFQEYSAEFKYQRNSAVGWLDPHTPNPIRGYNINDEFYGTANVSLSNYWMSCASEEVSFANCLAVPNPALAPQFIFDIRLDGTIYHPMKVYNIPGQGDLL